jgi:hypothetical protein
MDTSKCPVCGSSRLYDNGSFDAIGQMKIHESGTKYYDDPLVRKHYYRCNNNHYWCWHIGIVSGKIIQEDIIQREKPGKTFEEKIWGNNDDDYFKKNRW